MTFVAHLALVSESPGVGISEVTQVSAAIQKQVTRDLAGFWEVEGTVDAFPSLGEVPPGYWPLIVRDDIGQSAEGVHCDDTGQPMALITSDSQWSVTASHEAMEMLVDPSGNRTIAGPSVQPAQGRVEYLVEISDPVADSSYQVNGINVSDFYTPRFFEPVQANGVRYSFAGKLTAPRQILFGGYLTWFEPVSGQWWQQSWFAGDQPAFRSLGAVARTSCGMRPSIDRLSQQHRLQVAGKRIRRETSEAAHARRGVTDAAKAKAERWRARIEKIASGA